MPFELCHHDELHDPDTYTKWEDVRGDKKLPVNVIVVVFCGLWLSSPMIFKNQKEADDYKRKNGAVGYLPIPNAKLALKK